jgi:hypothetical protein
MSKESLFEMPLPEAWKFGLAPVAVGMFGRGIRVSMLEAWGEIMDGGMMLPAN